MKDTLLEEHSALWSVPLRPLKGGSWKSEAGIQGAAIEAAVVAAAGASGLAWAEGTTVVLETAIWGIEAGAANTN